MGNAFGSQGAPFAYQATQILYKLPAGHGVSGGPIITYSYDIQDFVVFGIHKGKVQHKFYGQE